jgi:hypothetical protein
LVHIEVSTWIAVAVVIGWSFDELDHATCAEMDPMDPMDPMGASKEVPSIDSY